MSAPPLRRTDHLMKDEDARAALARGFSGRLATIGADGYPYCVPLLYVVIDDAIYLHNTAARGHLGLNVEHDPRVCFQIDEPGEVFPYGRFECDTTVAFRSVIVFGTIGILDDRAKKQRFCEALMAKYAKPDWERPKGIFPRLDQITVYAIAIERLTGKAIPLPGVAEQWPARDRTKSPEASP